MRGPRSGRLACILLGLGAALIAALAGCARREPPAAGTAPTTLRISQRNEPTDLDPATAAIPDEFFIIRALGEGLLVPNPTGGAPLPGLAERFTVSPDGLEYTFHLHSGLQWSNGEPLTAADLRASYQRALAPATAATKAHLFFGVKNARAYASGNLRDFDAVGFRTPDARTLVVTLTQRLATFPRYVATGIWIPVNPRVVARHGRKWTDPAHHVGNGPFVLAEWRPQQRILVRRNPRYREARDVRLDQIEFARLDSEDTEDRAYRAGQIDVTMAVPRTRLDTYARERPAELHRLALAETRFLSFNTRRPPLNDARVRRALGLAVDRTQLIQHVLRGGQSSADRFLPPAVRSPGSRLRLETVADAAQARALLAAAGYPAGQRFPHLEVTAWSPSQVPVLEAVQAMWRRDLGIEVGIAIREARVHLEALTSGNYDIGFVTTLIDVADAGAVLQDFTTGAANNFPRWRSAPYDELLAVAAREPDPKRQADVLDRAEGLLLDEAPIAPLYFNVQNWLMSPRVRHWQQDPLWNRRYTEIFLHEN